MSRRTAVLATTILLVVVPPAFAADSSLNGYSDVGGVALTGVGTGNAGQSQSENSAVGGVSAGGQAAGPTRAEKAQAAGLGTLPFTGYDALAFGGVGLILVGIGAGLRSALRSRDPAVGPGPKLRIVDGGRNS